MFFIAEIGLNHNGNMDLACELMRQAQLSGADAVKMQLGWRGEKDELNYIDETTLGKFFRYADYLNTRLIFSVFNKKSFEMLDSFRQPYRYKIASRTLADSPELVKLVVDRVRETGRLPPIVSTGMWDLNVPLPHDRVDYLWCKSKYPTMPWDLTEMPKDFTKSQFAGYSDHSLGIEVPLIAIARGATIVEKHFTLDKSDTTIRDHTLSAAPEEFRTMVDLGNAIYRQISVGV